LRYKQVAEGLETVMPNGVCGVRNLSFSSVFEQERFLATLGLAILKGET